MNLCYETLPFSGGPSKRLPALAMDAALPSNGNGELIRALLQFATKLPNDQKVELETLIENCAEPNGAVAAKPASDAFKPSPERVEQAVAMLRAQSVDEDLIGKVCAAVGVAVPTVAATQAQDAAVRARIERSYASRFGGDAKIQLSTDPTKTYAARFPDAARIRCL